jgi:glucans biosynthesis protein
MERFVVDFAGDALRGKAADSAVEPVVNVGAGATLHHAAGQKNPINGTWRLAFTVRPDGTGRPVELRAFLRQGDDVLTETWSYLWQP